MTNICESSRDLFICRSTKFDDVQSECYSILFVINLVQEIQLQGNAIMETDNAMHVHFLEAAEKIKDKFIKNPLKFVNCLYNCVNFGQSLNENEYANYSGVFANIDYIETLHEYFEIDVTSFQNAYAMIYLAVVDDNTFYNIMLQINPLIERMIQNVAEIIGLLNQTFSFVIQHHLIPWKDQQRYILNGAQQINPIVLEIIQGWYQNIAKVCWKTHEYLNKCINICATMQLDKQESFMTFYEQFNLLLNSLITNSFIIEEQPPQVLKTQAIFHSSVRLLFGDVLASSSNPVELFFVNEDQARYIHQTNNVNVISCATILNHNTGVLDFNNDTKTLSTVFRNVQLTRRPQRTNHENGVMEEKYALFYKSNVSINNGEFTVAVWTLSMPIVVIVHNSQDLQATATIFWENLIPSYNNGLTNQASVEWHRLANALNTKFSSSMRSRGHYLTPENMSFLQMKAFSQQDPNETEITWQHFCRRMPNQKFPFWVWFYKTMKFTRDHLRDLWNDGCIIGFIDKPTTEAYLSNCKQGTFLLRFSDTLLGNIQL